MSETLKMFASEEGGEEMQDLVTLYAASLNPQCFFDLSQLTFEEQLAIQDEIQAKLEDFQR